MLKSLLAIITVSAVFFTACQSTPSVEKTPASPVASERVDASIKAYDDYVASLKATFAQVPVNPKSKAWVKKKLQHMFDVDQYTRKYLPTAKNLNFTLDEQKEFDQKIGERWTAVDVANTTDLKEILKIYTWIKISQFGKTADQQAWILVQHADLDREFQKSVLKILVKLYKQGETVAANYAYLFDRVASSYQNPSLRVPQRYGTQGACTGPGTWEPLPSEDPVNLDARRELVGLPPMAQYQKGFKDICL